MSMTKSKIKRAYICAEFVRQCVINHGVEFKSGPIVDAESAGKVCDEACALRDGKWRGFVPLDSLAWASNLVSEPIEEKTLKNLAELSAAFVPSHYRSFIINLVRA